MAEALFSDRQIINVEDGIEVDFEEEEGWIPAGQIRDIETLLVVINDSNNYLITRDPATLPFNMKFRVIKANRYNFIQDTRTVLIIDGKNTNFRDEFDGENFCVVLSQLNSRVANFDATRRLATNGLGDLFIARIDFKGRQRIHVFRFSFEKNN